MKKSVLMVFLGLFLSLAACGSKNKVPICPACSVCKECIQDGYGKQSSVAMCADIVQALCTVGTRCSEGFNENNCLESGLALCPQYTHITAAALVYDGCLEDLKVMSCQKVLNKGFTPPQSCSKALDEVNLDNNTEI